MLAKESGIETIIGPDHVLDTTHSQLCQLLLRLDVEKDNSRGGHKQQTPSPSKVDIGGRRWRLDCLRGGVTEILDINLLSRGIEDGKSIAGDKDSRRTGSTLDIGWFDCSSSISREVNQFVGPIVCGGCDKNRPLSGVVGNGTRGDPSRAQLAQGQHRRRLHVLREIVRPNTLILGDIEELVLVDSRCGPFPFELENHDTGIVASSEQVDLGVGSNDPKPV